MTTLALTITETLRYRGKLGQWSWALHRIAGLGTLVFLFLHVIDTSWAVFYPDLYREAISQYQSPLFTAGEFGLVACVVYHALNGFRIVLFDFKPQWWKYQARAAKIVLLLSALILVPTFFIMFSEVLRHYTSIGPLSIDTLRLPEIIRSNVRFLGGIIAVLILGMIMSAVYAVLPGANTDKTRLRRSGFDRFMWTYMRVSGVIIIPLVFGHLAMMHVIQGVFHITTANYVPIGTLDPNITGSAAEFVSLRWNTMFAGVFIWRIYDILLLFLVVIHGFYGLRYVINDYIHSKFWNRAVLFATLATALTLLILGGLAIINTLPVDTARMLSQSAAQALGK